MLTHRAQSWNYSITFIHEFIFLWIHIWILHHEFTKYKFIYEDYIMNSWIMNSCIWIHEKSLISYIWIHILRILRVTFRYAFIKIEFRMSYSYMNSRHYKFIQNHTMKAVEIKWLHTKWNLMNCNIDLANAQLKLWYYTMLESVHSPIHYPNSSHGAQAVDKHTYSCWHTFASSWDWSWVLTHLMMNFHPPNGSLVWFKSHNKSWTSWHLRHL